MYYDDDEYYSRNKYAGSYAHDVEGFSDDALMQHLRATPKRIGTLTNVSA